MSTLWHRLMLMLARGVVRAVHAETSLQTMKISALYDEDKDGLEHFETYGLTSNPPAGLEALVAFLGGDRSHGVIVAVGDRKFRLKGLQSGEVALYTDEGDYIHFQRGNKIDVTAGQEISATAPLITLTASSKIRADTPLFECTGEIKDLCDGAGRTMSAMRGVFNAHVHPENDNGGPTSAPTTEM